MFLATVFKPCLYKTSKLVGRFHLTTRCLCKQLISETFSKDCAIKNEQWNVLYKLPIMRSVRLISRAKVYQIVLMGGLCGLLYKGYTDGNSMISKKNCLYAFSGCIGTAFVFVVFSLFSTRLIGELSINNSQNIIRISHLSFLRSSRIESYYNVKEIQSWSDNSNDISSVFQRLHINGNNKTAVYFYTIRNNIGIVPDKKDLFYDVLGIPS